MMAWPFLCEDVVCGPKLTSVPLYRNRENITTIHEGVAVFLCRYGSWVKIHMFLSVSPFMSIN